MRAKRSRALGIVTQSRPCAQCAWRRGAIASKPDRSSAGYLYQLVIYFHASLLAVPSDRGRRRSAPRAARSAFESRVGLNQARPFERLSFDLDRP
ncbi:hypothetical protein D7S86_17130 [Pararobbsia silviterrae]|uniref:Uncharacterized protein n=1 Tax=Pararobbsia silviterrae TaxID=1792498 RepID=A0A494XS14_9BURK|nr:hypothetical protein D7S86_17130 [Pararobbsia silviterrae]